ncbi:MAG: M48 family peptidase [Hyphomicrobiaceae bacterium]|nr:MAG: M48 family peptidase [Hyphomicrobiaceae bacterium]
MIELNIHPDDILTFNEVVIAMKEVARDYNLPLRSITGLKMPLQGMADRLGDCNASGNIRLVLRCTVDGEWCEEPLDPKVVWDVAAHELAHLRHMNHGAAFLDFCEELQVAMNNKRPDQRNKLMEKIIKLQKSRDDAASRAKRGGFDAAEAQKEAEAFASAVSRLCLEHELNPNDVDYAAASDKDPVIELKVDYDKFGIEKNKARVAWMETLASHIGHAHFCQILIAPGSNKVWFVGTRSHATVAEYLFGTMVPAISSMSKKAELSYWRSTGCGRGKENKARGYRAAWIDAFVVRLWERFDAVRKEALAAQVAERGISNEVGLMRLEGAVMKVRQYVNDKFAGRKGGAGSLNHRFRDHAEGRAAGRAAADSVNLGKRGINSVMANKQIGSGS